MRVLAISPLDTDATASLYIDGDWHIIAEERLSRKKLHAGFPHLAVNELMNRTNTQPNDIDCITYPFLPWWKEAAHIANGYLREIPSNAIQPSTSAARHLNSYTKWCIRAIRNHRKYHQELKQELNKIGFTAKIERVEHHLAHAASAYLTSGFNEALAITLDWYGSGLSGSINICTPHSIKRLKGFRYPHSTGLLYAQVTRALGFKVMRHEGKIVGLAAFGNHKILGDKVKNRFTTKNGDLRYRCSMDERFANDLAENYPREHVAAAYQHALETIVGDIVRYWTQKTGLRNIALAGGVAANVKLNQTIAELHDDINIFIHPAMGDGGTGVGATLSVLFNNGQATSQEWNTCNLGPAYSESELQTAISTAGLNPVRPENWADAIAQLLAQGKVVARFNGAMEYGPRALGNRSILCTATDPAINNWLNQRLGRTEFMPFAPATLAGHHKERYCNIERMEAATRFMTITVRCTELMKRESPAAVHVDDTARPQIVRHQDNPTFHAILDAYYKRTGIPTIINTSFNMHEEPIVCTPKDAIRAFTQSKLDALSMGPFLITQPEQNE